MAFSRPEKVLIFLFMHRPAGSPQQSTEEIIERVEDPLAATIGCLDDPDDDIILIGSEPTVVRAELRRLEAEQAAYERRLILEQLNREVMTSPKPSKRSLTKEEGSAESAIASFERQEQRAAREAFDKQDRFRWSLCNAPADVKSAMTVKLVNGLRHPPEVPAMVVEVPDEPLGSAKTLDEQAEVLADRFYALQRVREHYMLRRKAAEFETEDSLFAPSSDDSDGYDEDHSAEGPWPDRTRAIYTALRSVEGDAANEGQSAKLAALLRSLGGDTVLTPFERQMVWDAIRLFHRVSEPLHMKRWLSSLTTLLKLCSFEDQPSVAAYCQVMRAALEVSSLTPRQTEKVKRWANRSVFLVRRRMLVLQEMGIMEPTWKQLNVSVAGLSRDEAVPFLTLTDAAALLATAIEQRWSEQAGVDHPEA